MTSHDSNDGPEEAPPQASADDLPLDLALPIPGYRLESELGRGGQGVVFRGVQLSLNRPVAIKVMHPRYLADRKARARFRKEAQLLAGLSHVNVVAIIDRGTEGPLGWLVMELVPGQTLADALTGEPVAPEDALALLGQVARGLDYCHAQGVVIRDLKPSNLLLDDHGAIKIADFGLAKIASGVEGVDTDTAITRTGQFFGTPRYMSPEQGNADVQIDHRTDLYSFGLIAYEVLTGSLPPHHLPPASERVLHLSPAVDRVIARMLDPKRENRFPSAAAFLDELKVALVRPVTGPVAVERTAAPVPATPVTPPAPVVPAAAPSYRAEALAAAAALALSVMLPLAGAAPSLPAPVPVWSAASPAPGHLDAVVARFRLPGPWWLRALPASPPAQPVVLALATDPLSRVTYLARLGPDHSAAPPVERFPLEPVAAELAPDGRSLVVATRDRALARVGLSTGLPIERRAALDLDPRSLAIAPDGTIAVAGAAATALFGSDLSPRGRLPAGSTGGLAALGDGRWLLADAQAVRVAGADQAVRTVTADGASGLAPGAPPWLFLGWSRRLERLASVTPVTAGTPRPPDGRNVPDAEPGPVAVCGDFAALPARAGVIIVSLADGKTRSHVAFELPVTALLALPGQVWVASRHGDLVALVQ